MPNVTISPYACENADLFESLKEISFFRKFVDYQYRVSLSNTALEPEISEYACNLAYARYVDDVKRMLTSEYDGEGSLDHFKQSAFLVFWLRRFSPISEVYMKSASSVPVKLRSEKPKEAHYYYLNQNVAFDIGFRVIRFWEGQRVDSEEIYGRKVDARDFDVLPDSARGKFFLKDLNHTLTAKSISPHALWMIYRAYFYQILSPVS